MPRLARFSLALPPFIGALAVLLACPIAPVQAESAAFLRPELDGNPRNPPRFQRPGAALRDARAAAQSASSFQPGSGVGSTGFDSSGKRKAKVRAGEKTKPAAKAADGSKTASLPSRYGSPNPNPLAPKGLAVPPAPTGVARKGASPYYAAPEAPEPPRRRRPLPEDAPFDPIGIQVGAFNFKPAVELTGGYDTNPGRSANPVPSWYSLVTPELKFSSNWARHSFSGDLRGSYNTYGALPSLNRPAVDSKLIGRVDVTTDTRIDLETKFLLSTDSPGSPNIQAGLAKLPIFTTWGGTVGLGHRFNRFDVALKGSAERTVYQDSTFTDGSTASNQDRNYNRYSTQLRGSYELTPGIKPFVEVGADRRIHDLDVDAFGMQRNSDGRSVKGGTTFELSRILTGDVAVGWLTRHYQDPTLPHLSGLTFDASLTWLASALTTAKLTAVTRADESRVAGVAGVFTREVALQVDHAFRRWLIATGRILYGNDNYVGSARDDDRYSAAVSVTYKLTRELWLKSEYRHEWMRSSIPGVKYDADVFLLGLRAQR